MELYCVYPPTELPLCLSSTKYKELLSIPYNMCQLPTPPGIFAGNYLICLNGCASPFKWQVCPPPHGSKVILDAELLKVQNFITL